MEKEILYRLLVASNRGETYLSYGFADDEIAEVKEKFERLDCIILVTKSS